MNHFLQQIQQLAIHFSPWVKRSHKNSN